MEVTDEFVQLCLYHHNRVRGMHNVRPLRYNTDLSHSAQEWANECLKMDILKNSPTSASGLVGESISMRRSSSGHAEISGADVVEQWYKDADNYDFSDGTGSAGNFTQMIWASTTDVGFGKATKDGKTIVVVHYRPPGNVKGYYTENVFPTADGKIAKLDNGHRGEKYDMSHKAKEKNIIERYKDDMGRCYIVKKEIIQFVDDLGHVTEKIKETRIDGENGNEIIHTHDETDEEFQERIKHMDTQQQESECQAREFRRKILDAHNAYRLQHGANLLTQNRELTMMAQKWADLLLTQAHLQNSHFLYHGNSLGENIASRWVSGGECNYPAQDVVDHWYNESKSYDYNKEYVDIQGIGNFTQLVWKNSRETGIGRSAGPCDDGKKVVVVALYYPPGNVMGGFCANVKAPVNSQ